MIDWLIDLVGGDGPLVVIAFGILFIAMFVLLIYGQWRENKPWR